MNPDDGKPLPGATVLDPLEPEPATLKPTPKKASKRKDRFAEINGFADFTLRDLTPAAVAVWLLLWRDTKPNGVARTSQADLARRSGRSERAVRDAIKQLLERGLLKIVARGHSGKSSSYRVRGVTKG